MLLSTAGVWSRKPYLVWIGAILIIPIALYLSAAPAYPFVGFVPLVALVVAALTCRKTARWQSWTGISVYSVFLFALAFIVLNQSTP